jgi:hypothetical protein
MKESLTEGCNAALALADRPDQHELAVVHKQQLGTLDALQVARQQDLVQKTSKS